MICSKFVDKQHLIEPKNKYLVDTNILLYLYGNSSFKVKDNKKEELSTKFCRALDLKCDVYVPAIVISEFINRYHKNEFNKMKEKSKNLQYKKDYRNTERFIKNNKFIINTVRETILDRCKLINDNFSNVDIEKIFSENDNQEFNDNLIIDIANKNGLYLISADIDASKIKIK